ncbi:DsbA family oxidoreductase [Peribacillus deserti]|uniref:Disulfide bond formation protein DsbA n=1 Tax=Peribacillus deserti TaxID=673318 RepID=A0A2N5M3D5_9BACI|nr:DsbA family oxidoreductase [Peribacillus deserti]PLT28835.1 disulfide bond formation protein DsbA [Peribacillus deserti]
MKIEVWSDFVCPFCYIGKRRLEEALAQFPNRDSVELEFKSFELDPNAEKFSGKNIHEALAEKYGMTIEQARNANAGVGQQAATVGLSFNFEDMKPTNTFDAHRLAKFAKTQGKEALITEELLHAYFTDSKDLGNLEVLADLGSQAGLDRQEAMQVLEDKNAYSNDVRIDEAIAQQYGVTGVPFFVINQKYAISGAQPKETFVNAIQKVWLEENPAPKLQDLSGNSALDASCSDGSCAVPNDKE